MIIKTQSLFLVRPNLVAGKMLPFNRHFPDNLQIGPNPTQIPPPLPPPLEEFHLRSRLTASATFWSRWLCVTGNGTCAATSEGMQPLPCRTATNFRKPRLQIRYQMDPAVESFSINKPIYLMPAALVVRFVDIRLVRAIDHQKAQEATLKPRQSVIDQ